MISLEETETPEQFFLFVDEEKEAATSSVRLGRAGGGRSGRGSEALAETARRRELRTALGGRQDARRGMARTSFGGGALCGVLQRLLRDSARGHTAGACSRHVSEGPAHPRRPHRRARPCGDRVVVVVGAAGHGAGVERKRRGKC